MLRHTLSEFDQDRFEHFVACLIPAGPVAVELEKDGFEVFSAGMAGMVDFVPAVMRLFRYLRKLKVDVLHTYLTHANVAGRLLAPLVGRPLLINSFRSVSMNLGGWLVRTNAKTAFLADAVTASSDSVKDYYHQITGYPHDRIFIIPNGLPMDFFTPPWDRERKREYRASIGLPEDCFLIGAVGTFRPEKAYEVLLEAFAGIVGKLPDARLAIVGEGALRNKMEDVARNLGITGRVFFLGARRDIVSFDSAIDLFLHASRQEGFGIAIVEAMAREIPVISTNAGGIPEIIDHGIDGLLVDPEDPQALSDAVVSLSGDPAGMRSMAEAGRMKASTLFTVERVAERTEDLYEKLLNEKNK